VSIPLSVVSPGRHFWLELKFVINYSRYIMSNLHIQTCIHSFYPTFEVLTAVTVKIIAFHNVTCSLAEVYKYSSKASVKFYQTIWHHIPEDSTLQDFSYLCQWYKFLTIQCCKWEDFLFIISLNNVLFLGKTAHVNETDTVLKTSI
jgi:hypothetical protein